ncbi:AbgT family transporter, partial [Intestinimonas massiliensis]
RRPGCGQLGDVLPALGVALGSADELYDIGWEDYLARGGVCAVEWSEIVRDALEPGCMPYAIATMIAELAILAVWWALKLPLGPGVGMFIH